LYKYIFFENVILAKHLFPEAKIRLAAFKQASSAKVNTGALLKQ